MAKEFLVENARLLFKNFEGRASKFNKEGDRNFNLVIDNPDLKEDLINDGWNIKSLPPREEGDDFTYILPVAVKYPEKFERFWPKVTIISNNHKTEIGEDEIKMIDWADAEAYDVVVRPREWIDDDGRKRIKAFLSQLVVILKDSRLEEKYADLPFGD